MFFRVWFLLYLFSLSYLVEGFGKQPRIRLQENVVPQPEITKVNIIFMNHLDVGYSDYLVQLPGLTANVLNTYFNVHFPKAISLAQQMRAQGYAETFRYTTHPWLLYFFLHCPPNLFLANIKIQCPNAASMNSMVEAIKIGDIVWHDGSMNNNYENMNAFGLEVSLNISANLNRQFGITKPLRVISLRDVPGLSRGVIRTLLANNIVGITHGVNSGSAPPNVPKLCRWRAAPRSNGETNIPEIIFMQNPKGYPDLPGPNPNSPGGMSSEDCFQTPGSTEMLCFFFRNDNTGPPQSIQEVLSGYEIVRGRYPNAKLYAGVLEEFFTVAWKNKHLLPMVDVEIGDTWIQGTASDPKRFARFRALQREFQFYYQLGLPMSPEVINASVFMVKPAEHTYGLDSCQDSINWSNDQFKKARNQPGMVLSELSWVEQRQYEQLVLDTLGPNHRLTKSILKAFKDLETLELFNGDDLKKTVPVPKNPHHQTMKNSRFDQYGTFEKDLEDYKIQDDTGMYTCTSNGRSINVSFQDGAISHLNAKNLKITPENPLGKLIYNTYNESDTDFFLKYYKTYWNTGYGKPNSTINAYPESKEWKIIQRDIYRKLNSPCSFMCIVSAEDPRASTYYGFPGSVLILWDINIDAGEISTVVYWENKQPTRLMESISFKFLPRVNNTNLNWYFSKMGEPISPYSVVLNGSQWQHTVDDSGVFIASAPDAKPAFRVIPWDTGISCPITKSYGPTVWPAPLFPIKEKLTGVAFNFYNNVWNTNFIYWYPFKGVGTENDDRFKARFTTQLSLITTPSDTLRY